MNAQRRNAVVLMDSKLIGVRGEHPINSFVIKGTAGKRDVLVIYRRTQ